MTMDNYDYASECYKVIMRDNRDSGNKMVTPMINIARSRFIASNEPPKSKGAPEVPSRFLSPTPTSKGSRKPRRRASIQFGKSSSEQKVASHQKADPMASSDHSKKKSKKSPKDDKGSKKEQQKDEFMELDHSNHKLIRKVRREKSKLSADRTKKIVEEATAAAASAVKDLSHVTTASQEEVDMYGYGYACPDEGAEALAPMATQTVGRVPTLMVGAGKAPRRSSLKSSSDHGPPRRRRSSLIHIQQQERANSDGYRSMKKGLSIQFADYDEVQEVEPAKNLTWENSDLWYQPKEIRVINQHNRYMVDVAKSGAATDRKICIRGLETFLIPSADRKARQNKLYDSIMMIQDHERQHGVLDVDLMSRVCRRFSDEDSEVATTRALEDAIDTQKFMAKKTRRSGRRQSCNV